MKSVEVNVNSLYPLEISENPRFFMFLGDTKRNVAKWVKQQQYWRERQNVMLLA